MLSGRLVFRRGGACPARAWRSQAFPPRGCPILRAFGEGWGFCPCRHLCHRRVPHPLTFKGAVLCAFHPIVCPDYFHAGRVSPVYPEPPRRARCTRLSLVTSRLPLVPRHCPSIFRWYFAEVYNKVVTKLIRYLREPGEGPNPQPKTSLPQQAGRNTPSAENTHQICAILIANEMRSPASGTNSKHATYDFLIANEFHSQNTVLRTKASHQDLPHKSSDVVYPETRKGTELQLEICLQPTRKGG